MRFVLQKSAESLDMRSVHRVTALLGRRKFEPALSALLDSDVGQSAQSEARPGGLIQI
jgi:hypothetical protein